RPTDRRAHPERGRLAPRAARAAAGVVDGRGRGGIPRGRFRVAGHPAARRGQPHRDQQRPHPGRPAVRRDRAEQHAALPLAATPPETPKGRLRQEPPLRVLDDQKSMPPPMSPAAGAGFFSGLSATTASVVRKRPAIEAALSSAERVTLTGSLMPAESMSTYSPVAALRP